MLTSNEPKRACPACGEKIHGIFNPVPKAQLRWYSSSTMAGCPHCHEKLEYDTRSRLWLGLVLLPCTYWLLDREHYSESVFYALSAVTLLGMLIFVRTRKLIATGRKLSPSRHAPSGVVWVFVMATWIMGATSIMVARLASLPLSVGIVVAFFVLGSLFTLGMLASAVAFLKAWVDGDLLS